MKIEKGMYISIKDIPDAKTWKKCIDSFVKAGAFELEGYTNLAMYNYIGSWNTWKYLGFTSNWNIYHNNDSSYYEGKQISLKQLISSLEETTMKEFKKEDLKTGMRITTSDGSRGIVFRDVAHSSVKNDKDRGDCVVYVSSSNLYNRSWDTLNCVIRSGIISVEIPYSPYAFTVQNGNGNYELLWQKEVLSPAEIEKEAIKAEMDKLSKRLAALEVK